MNLEKKVEKRELGKGATLVIGAVLLGIAVSSFNGEYYGTGTTTLIIGISSLVHSFVGFLSGIDE